MSEALPTTAYFREAGMAISLRLLHIQAASLITCFLLWFEDGGLIVLFSQ